MDDDLWISKRIGDNILLADKNNRCYGAYLGHNFRYRKEFIPELEAEAAKWEVELHAKSLKARFDEA